MLINNPEVVAVDAVVVAAVEAAEEVAAADVMVTSGVLAATR